MQLTVICLGSVAGITVTIVVATGLWERSPHPAALEQFALFNIVTAATVVATLCLALFAIMLARRCWWCRATCSAWSSGSRSAWPTR